MTTKQTQSLAEVYARGGFVHHIYGWEDLTAACPHCGAVAGFRCHTNALIGSTVVPALQDLRDCEIQLGQCRSCGKLVVGALAKSGGAVRGAVLLWPPSLPPDRAPADLDDEEIRRDYKEARETLAVSTRASAVMSRRCLQHLIRKKMGIRKDTLNLEIKEVLTRDELSNNTRQVLHDIRETGNLGAHPEYDNATALIDVERGEAEYLLEAVELVFHDLYVAPAKISVMKAKLKQKSDAKRSPSSKPSTP